MRLPNGYGSIIKLTGNRRKPWAVRVTTGYDDKGKQIRKYIGYYKKRQDAIETLSRYNENPLLIDNETITFSELYEKWTDKKFPKLSESAKGGYVFGYNKCETIYDMKMKDIKTIHLQKILDDMDGMSKGSKRKVRTLLNQLFIFATVNDIVLKNYAEYLELGKTESKIKRKPFTNQEIKKMFTLVNEIKYIDTALMMIYTGFRIGELLDLKNNQIDLINKTIKGGAKTQAGKDRIIPIHPKIYDLVVNRYDNKNKYFITNTKNQQMKYSNYKREYWEPMMEELGFRHNPHDCRHTFATLLNNAGANGTSIKKLIGHSSFSFTEKVYTHKDVEDLRVAIEKI